jgi:hypothetical protein
VRLEGLGELKNVNDLIETSTLDFTACGIVSQLTTLPYPNLMNMYVTVNTIQMATMPSDSTYWLKAIH